MGFKTNKNIVGQLLHFQRQNAQKTSGIWKAKRSFLLEFYDKAMNALYQGFYFETKEGYFFYLIGEGYN